MTAIASSWALSIDLKEKWTLPPFPTFPSKLIITFLWGGGGLSGGPVDDKTFNGILHLETIKRLPDQFTLNITLKDKKDPKKSWQMNISVKLTQSGQTTYTLNTTKSAPDFSYTIQKINFSKSETILMIHPSKHPTPRNHDSIMDFMIMDDRGIVIDGSMGSGYFDENGSYVYRMYYSPLKRIPRSLTIIPYYPFKHTKKLRLPIPHIEAKMDHSPTPEKPILLSMGDAGKIRIIKWSFILIKRASITR
ncbi:DUF5643 domain-containing protein [Polycladomyces subterraneus]|uniref:DUF5643 domain-containing protein n=1 Tax=Polycladomyces subterraneus TaxID=1016997 RepID=A0ABT8IRM2_9BACL|nr:DUF5643 domain-containing protein [Polycladomyces subterraneus]MDN4595433.1 DUF5643 domain-containing protein [Polycladomyces subterraneus]